VSQKATQKQITIVKIDNRRQVRKRSNAVATAPPPVLRGVSALPQPIIPLPPPPDLYETNVLRQRVERLERVREPVREPIREPITASTGTSTEAPPAVQINTIPTQTPQPPVAEAAPLAPVAVPTSLDRFRERMNIRLSAVNALPFRVSTEPIDKTDTEVRTIRANRSAGQIQRWMLRRAAEAEQSRRLAETIDEDDDEPPATISLGGQTRGTAQTAPVPSASFADPAEEDLTEEEEEEELAELAKAEPFLASAPSSFGDRGIVSIRVNRPKVLKDIMSLDEYKQKVANTSFTLFNKQYVILSGKNQKAVRDRVLEENKPSAI